MGNTKWDPLKKCLEEDCGNEDNLMASLYGHEALADWEEVDSLNVPEDPTESVTMDLSLLFNMAPRLMTEGYNDNLSLATMKTGTSNATGVAAAAPPDKIVVSKDDSPTVASSLTNGSVPPSGASSQGAGVSIANG